MMKKPLLLTIFAAACLLVLAAACASKTYSDPFVYCTAMGTIDQPDARYSGEKVSDAVIEGYKQAAGLQDSTEPSDIWKQATVWRCMDKQVYACNFGANLPCTSKANTNKTPTQAMSDFCKENPGSDFIPMAVTGHDTVYNWSCVKDTATAGEQLSQVDAAGFISNIWYKIEKK
jgi:hypothetical protein